MERNFNTAAPIIAGLLGFFVSGYFIKIAEISEANRIADKRVDAVQKYNAQLTDQLSDSYTISGLVVDDEAGTFEFTSTLPGSGTETCTGNFVVENDIARGVGSVACTVQEEING
ncbi:hypothetical protein KC960_03090 [Candidatus Saccharibacteria bacterium]|nr:hypothetical protein [Candidatus Saccharibacteria bacterium]